MSAETCLTSADPTPEEMPGLAEPLPELRPESGEAPATPTTTTSPAALGDAELQQPETAVADAGAVPEVAAKVVEETPAPGILPHPATRTMFPTREVALPPADLPAPALPDPAGDTLDADEATAIGGATELEPEDATGTEALTETPGQGASSVYPGQLSGVRAPGWDHSGTRNQAEVRARESNRHRPQSAPELQPSSVPNLTAMPKQGGDRAGQATPPPPTAAQPPMRKTHSIVEEAAKELARAALAAEIEKEEKRAMHGYTPEEGEIPPSPEVAKRFDVILQLGKGGMGVVYLCRDPRGKGKVIAVKDIRTELKPGMKVEQRVEHEAKLLKELDHPGIVKVYDFLKFPRGSAIVMEFIDGLPLDHEIGAGRRITWDFGVRVLKEIGAALGYAHSRGVIHRDIKPDNILYSERHNVMKLVDFGLARIYGEPMDVHLTRTGMVVGTPHYMSPEQVSGKQLDQRSDVYSFGATLYYLMTGQRHVEGSNVMDILEQQRSREITPPSWVQRDIPAWVSYVIGKMMEIKLDDRYQSMAAVLAEVEQAEKDPEAFLASPPRGPVKRYGNRPLIQAAAAETTPVSGLAQAANAENGEEVYHLDQTDQPPPALPAASPQAPETPERQTDRVKPKKERRTDAAARGVLELLHQSDEDQAVSLAQVSGLLKQISARLDESEKRQMSPGVLMLVVLLSTLAVVLLVVGGLLLAAREGFLARLLNL